MAKCPICSSILQFDIEKMIDSGANIQHIQSWARERDLKLTKKAIETHKVKHYGYIEKVERSLEAFEPISMTTGQIESILNLSQDELVGYLEANNLKPHYRKKYDLIDILRYFNDRLSREVDLLQTSLKQLTSKSHLSVMAELKQSKLEAQTRLLKAVARTKTIELDVALGKLVSDRELENSWSYSLVGFKAKLEAIPNKLALELSAIESDRDIKNLLSRSIAEALSELQHGCR